VTSDFFIYNGRSMSTGKRQLTMHFLTSTPILALLALTPSVSAQISTNSSTVPLNFNCSSFNPGQNGAARQNYTMLSNSTFRVSRAVVCSPTASDRDPTCTISSSGRLRINATSNATDIPDPNALHSMLYDALKSGGASTPELSRFNKYNDHLSFNGTGQTHRVEPGTAAYIGFKPNMTCYEGVVSTNESCHHVDEGVRNVKERFEGRALRICVPNVYRRTGKATSTRLGGMVETVEVSEEVARTDDMKRNPAQTSESDDDDEDEDERGSPRPRPSGTVLGGSGRVQGTGWSVVLEVLGVVGMVGM
jgi:hypothetical protein